MTALICGSMAFDTVMVFQGRFREHILPDRIHMLNVSFLAPSMRRNFGGCAGNIAYNLNLLGGDGLMLVVHQQVDPAGHLVHLHPGQLAGAQRQAQRRQTSRPSTRNRSW